MRIKRNLNLLWIFTICTNTLFLIPVILPYYSDVIGIGYREFLLGEAGFAFAIVLFDVPTGWISDVWRRKHTLALGIVINVVGWGSLLFAHSLWQAVLAQFMLGIGYSLISGTHTALLYDSLLSVEREQEYRRNEGKRLALSLYAIAGASVVGGFLYTHDHFLPIYAMLVTYIGGFISALMMDEPERHKHIRKKHPVIDILQTLKYALHGHAEIAFIIIFTAVMFCSTKQIMWSQQPYYMALHFPNAAFGILMAVGYCLGGLSSHMGHLLDGKVKTFRALVIAWLAAFLISITAGASINYIGVMLLMFGGSCIFGMTSPRVNVAINRLVGSDRRATILSTQSFMTNLLAIPMNAFTGFVSSYGGVRYSLFAVAAWLCLAGACLGIWKIRRRTLV
jgi:MFS family permease